MTQFSNPDMSLPQLRFISATLHCTPTRICMPLRFSIAVMTRVSHGRLTSVTRGRTTRIARV